MSTRGMIARPKGDGFAGRYHHYDSYPDGLGATLYDLANGHFRGDLKGMMRFLVDKHRAGWSTINGADFNLKPGFDEYRGATDRPYGPACYCHGSRREKAALFKSTDTDHWLEWAYVIDEETGIMTILEWDDTYKEWAHRGQVNLHGAEPKNWDAFCYTGDGND